MLGLFNAPLRSWSKNLRALLILLIFKPVITHWIVKPLKVAQECFAAKMCIFKHV